MLALGNQTLMDRTGQHRDAVSAYLVAEVLAGDADGTRTGGTQDIRIQVVPLLRGQQRAGSRHHKQASTSVPLALYAGGSSDKAIRGDQTSVRQASLLGSDPVRSGTDASANLRKALRMGGVFAVSTVLPEKIQHLAHDLATINRSGTDGELDHGLQVLGCFLVLSVLI